MILTRPKLFLLDQNDLNGPKSVWTHKRTRNKCTYVNLINSTNTSLSEYLIELCDVQDHQYFLSYHVRLSHWLRRLHKQVSVNVQSLDRKFKFINVGVVMYAGFVTYFDHLVLGTKLPKSAMVTIFIFNNLMFLIAMKVGCKKYNLLPCTFN